MISQIAPCPRPLIWFWLLLCTASTTVFAADKFTIFAAASTTNAVTEVVAAYQKVNHGTEIATSYASSSTLAKQIASGAPAHVYISADQEWMNFLEERKLIDSASRRVLLSNQLVVIAPNDSKLNVTMEPSFDFAKALGGGKLCMGDPDHVPAGKYGKAALIYMTWWDAVAPAVVPAEDVRSALAFIERKECVAGIVYSTDAKISTKVKILDAFPAASHKPIEYPAALVGTATPAAKKFFSFLAGKPAALIFRKYGFVTP